MKKQIISTITLPAVLILSLIFCISAYAGEPDRSVIDELQSYKIIEPADDLRLNDNLTRAEAVKILCVAGGYGEIDHVQAFDFFPDVPTTHWAAKYISVGFEDHFIHGDENGYFNPENYISYQDFEKILVCILGYGEYAKLTGGYPSGYLTWGSSLGLNQDLGSDYTADITRGDAMIMIHNALDVPLLVHTQTNIEADGSETPIYEMRDGETYPLDTLRIELDNLE